jgi:hypothetical protein
MGPVMVISIVVPIALQAKNENDAHGVRSQIEKLWNNTRTKSYSSLNYLRSSKLLTILINCIQKLKKLKNFNSFPRKMYSDNLDKNMKTNGHLSGGSLPWVLATKLGGPLALTTGMLVIPKNRP